MQSFYRQLQGSTCNGKQAQTEKEKEQQRAKCSNWEEVSKNCKEQEQEENGEETSALSRNADFRRWKQEKNLQLCRKRGKWKNIILQKQGELFVTCLKIIAIK